ncbi:MAG: hypothetical protein MJE68_04400 [Proteobacteria bacterium]|nr:hypothetical protein [Pseudomonadota bacterium]
MYQNEVMIFLQAKRDRERKREGVREREREGGKEGRQISFLEVEYRVPTIYFRQSAI